MTSRTLVTVGLALLTVCSNGCLWEQYGTLRSAEGEYQDCRADDSRPPGECDGLRAKRDATLDRYERDAAGQWGCRNTSDGCLDDIGAPNS